MKQHKWHKEIKAWADGAEIERIWVSDDYDDPTHWHIVDDPEWNEPAFEFRIKPQTMFNGLTEEETNNTASVMGLKCNSHPKAPHGFNRNASHNSNNYVCDCEGWDAWQDGYEEGLRKGLELEQPKEPQYLYVYYDADKTDFEFWDKTLDEPIGNKDYIGKIKLEVEE